MVTVIASASKSCEGTRHVSSDFFTILLRILMNLIGNAIKFTQQGEVIVSCGLEKDLPADLDPPLSEDEIMLKFAVQDTGIGMFAVKYSIRNQ